MGVLGLVGTIACVAAFVVYGAVGPFPLCGDERGLTLTFIAPAVAAGACIALSALETRLARIAASLAGAILVGGATWWIVARVFAAHCAG